MEKIEKPKKLFIEKLKQPKALYLLFFVQMWESFSYYGMRAILVLYMITQLKLSDSQAFGIYAVSTALSEFLAVIGGILADKVFGLKYAINLGGIIIIFGHIILALPFGENILYLSLALIAIGTGLLRTNCTALLGEFYHKNDARRDEGYTLFYVGLNFGAFIATILCAYVAENYGYHYGFSLAAIGMLMGLVGLFKFAHILENKGKKPINSIKNGRLIYTLLTMLLIPVTYITIFFHEISIYLLMFSIFSIFIGILFYSNYLPKNESKNVKSILLSIVFLALFYGFEEQVGSTLIVFAERFSDKLFLNFSVPAAALTTINPLTILVLGPLVALVLKLCESKSKKSVSIYFKISLAFALQGLAFFTLSIYITGNNIVSANVIGLSFAIIAFSELFIGPAVYAHCSKLSPEKMKGILMGTVMMGFAMANIFSGFISKYMAIDKNPLSGNEIYYDGFIKIMAMCVVASIIIGIINITLRTKND